MSRLHRIPREYPNHNGIPVPFHEIDLPVSTLDLDKQDSYNNHHSCFTARAFGRTAISQTFRDLAIYQDVVPKDVHAIAHDRYDPPHQLPSLLTMLDIIDEQMMQNGLIRYGSALHPSYKGITRSLRIQLMDEYDKIA